MTYFDIIPKWLHDWEEENYPELKSGDIFATKGTGLIGWLHKKLFAPSTSRFHFGLLWHKVNNDWIILESINKGIAVGRLSFYMGKNIRFYRANCPYGTRRKTGIALTKYGRSRYDYWLIVKIVVGCGVALVRNLLKGKIRKLKAEDLPYASDSSLICTEAVDIAYLAVGYPITNPSNVPLPSAFEQARLDGRIREL